MTQKRPDPTGSGSVFKKPDPRIRIRKITDRIRKISKKWKSVKKSSYWVIETIQNNLSQQPKTKMCHAIHSLLFILLDSFVNRKIIFKCATYEVSGPAAGNLLDLESESTWSQDYNTFVNLNKKFQMCNIGNFRARRWQSTQSES